MFEFKVVPAPRRGTKAKGAKGTEARFAVALQDVMNELGAQGWDYVRAETLPCDERVGLTGKATTFQNLLVFRRALKTADAAPAPMLIAPPELAAPVTAPAHAAPPAPVPPPAPIAIQDVIASEDGPTTERKVAAE